MELDGEEEGKKRKRRRILGFNVVRRLVVPAACSERGALDSVRGVHCQSLRCSDRWNQDRKMTSSVSDILVTGS